MRPLGLLVCAALALACNRIEPTPAPRASGPNVLLVTVDTLRADHVGAYGAEDAETPHLDALATAGVRFETVIAQTPLTLPSHASLHTGQLPPAHGVRHNGIFRLDAAAVTLAERLRDAGYETGAVVGSIVLAARFGLDQGFDHYDEDTASRRASATGYPERRAPDVTDAARRWIAEREGSWFLWVHYYDAHASYEAPEPFASRFRDRPYDGEIAYVDVALGDLLASAGEDTLVAVTSDHGESLGEHDERTHAYTVYDAALRVPWLMRGPGVPAGRVVVGVVSLVDVAPTLLGLLDLAPLAAADGRDLSSFAVTEAHPAYVETLAGRLDHGWAPLFGLRSDEHLYVRAPRPELYELEGDPHQRRNRFEKQRETAERYEQALSAVLETERPVETVALDRATRLQIEALGYAVPETPRAARGIDPKQGLRLVGPFIEAKSAFFAGDLRRAHRLAEALAEKMPGSAQLERLRASIERAEGRLDRALEHSREAVRLLPGSAELWLLLAHDSLNSGHAEDAAAAYERAVVIGAEDVSIRLQAAEGWERLRRPERALAEFREALRLAPDSERAHMGLAILLVRTGRGQDAERHIGAAGAFAQDPALRNRLGVGFALAGENERAAAIFEALIAEHPDYESPRRNLARLRASD